MKLDIPQYAQHKKVGERETTWNFNDPLGWEKFHNLTSRDMSLVWCWDDSCSADVSYDIWSKKSSTLRKCFKKKRVRRDKPRSLLDKRQGIKKHVRKCGSSQCRIKSKLRKLDTLIDKRVTAFNSTIVAKGVGKDGTISKLDVWKIKRVLTPRSFNVPYCVVDSFGNEITDENSIRQQNKNEFNFRLKKRSIVEELKDYEKLNNLLCGAILQNSKGNSSPDFNTEEMEVVLKELKTVKCIDLLGFVREMFINGGEALTQSLLQMANSLKRMKSVPVNWSRMCIQTLKKKTGSTRKLSSYRGIFLVPVLSIIFEKLLKNKITPHLNTGINQHVPLYSYIQKTWNQRVISMQSWKFHINTIQRDKNISWKYYDFVNFSTLCFLQKNQERSVSHKKNILSVIWKLTYQKNICYLYFSQRNVSKSMLWTLIKVRLISACLIKCRRNTSWRNTFC